MEFRIPASPWGLFLVLVVSNTLLSYGPFSLQAKLWIGLFGILLPLALVLLDRGGSWKRAFEPQKTGSFVPPTWAWAAVLILAVGMRFYRLTTLSSWPTSDEGTMGTLAQGIAQGGTLPWFFESNHMPLLFHHGLALLFRWFQPSLAVLWTYPALLSLATVLFVWRGALHFFTPGMSLILTALWAGSFPLVYTGRFCLPHAALLFAMALAFHVWARWRASRGKVVLAWALLLGVLAGVGFHLYLTWAVVAVLIAAAFHLGGGRRPGRVEIALFWGPLVLCVLPVFLYMAGQPMNYLREILSMQKTWGGTGRWGVLSSNITALFWGVDTPLFAYKPFWGGFLNPLAGSMFLVGACALAVRRPRLAAGSCAAFLVLMAPGLVTNHLEFMRVAQVFPLLVLGAAFGLRTLAGNDRPRTWVFVSLMLAFSAALDFHHLAGPYASFWVNNRALWHSHQKSPENHAAYHALREKARHDGPGMIFTDFLMDPGDRTFWLASLPFNAIGNKALEGPACRWAALVTNVHYKPFLQRRFPEATWTWLSEGLSVRDGGSALMVLPLSGKPPFPVDRWKAAHVTFSAVNERALHGVFGGTDSPSRDILEKDRDLFRGDPFLESLYGHRLFLSYSIDRRPREAARAVHQALLDGYPAAQLYNDYACVLAFLGERENAKRAFRQAMAAPFNRTRAAQNLQKVEMERPSERLEP